MGNGRHSGLPTGIRNTTSRTKVNTDGLTVFLDKRDSYRPTHQYDGDGADTIEFFKSNSNYRDLIGQMSINDIEAFESWSEGYFMSSDRWISSFSQLGPIDQRYIKTFDTYIDQSRLTTGIVVSRSDGPQLLGFDRYAQLNDTDMQALVGTNLSVRGNMSFAAASEGLTIGNSSKNIEYKLNIPKGTVGAGMYIGDDDINGWGAAQREFLTNRDIVVRVKSIKSNKTSSGYIVELDYVGREKHRYN